MVKKRMLLLLACASFLGLTACSNSNGSSVKKSSSETNSSSDKENGNLSAEVKGSDGDNGKKAAHSMTLTSMKHTVVYTS